MLELYRSELKRFRHYAALYALAHLLVLATLQQLIDLASAPIGLHLMMLAFYMLSGLGFALYQFGTYRKPGRWIWLQHRPLHRARILAALALVALTAIVLAVALPLSVFLAAQEHYTRHVIDWRHYAGAAYFASSALSAWLAGGYIALHRSRWAAVILVLPVVMTMYPATAATVVGLSLACNALLLVLLYTVFRPNRYAGDDAAATIVSALPMQVGFYVALVWAGSMLFQLGLMMAGAHPQSSDHVARGGGIEAMRSTPAEAIRAGLEASTDPRAAAWRAQLSGQKPSLNGSPAGMLMVRQHTVRDALMPRSPTTFNDGENHWTFSHDRMMYRGVNARTHQDLGWMGPGGTGDAFDTQPRTLSNFRGGAYLVTAHDLYEQPAPGKGWRRLLHLDGSEQLASSVSGILQHPLVLTNRRLVILDGADRQPSEVRLPLPVGDLARVDAAQVGDGMLVSFVSGYRRLDGVTAAPQIVVLADGAGHVQEVARRALAHDFPLLFEHKDWWVSPALHALVALPELMADTGLLPDDGASRYAPLLRARPAEVWCAAIVGALLSGAGAAWWARRANLTRQAGLAWCLACLLLGMPALLSLMVLQPGERRARLPAALSAPV